MRRCQPFLQPFGFQDDIQNSIPELTTGQAKSSRPSDHALIMQADTLGCGGGNSGESVHLSREWNFGLLQQEQKRQRKSTKCGRPDLQG